MDLTEDWKIREPGDLFDKNDPTTERHREDQRCSLKWLQEWSQFKVKPQSRAHGQYIPKRLQIVITAEATLQEGLRPSGYTTLSKEAMMVAVPRCSGRAPGVMKSVAASREPNGE